MGDTTSGLKKGLGFTLIELLVVVAIVGLLSLLTALAVKPSLQLAKARDGRRKSDLKLITTALENYAGDNSCYPEESAVVCGGNGLSPYLGLIPCDPLTKASYYYVRPDNCKEYSLYTELEIDEGLPEYGVGNYAIVSGNLTTPPVLSIATPTATPTVKTTHEQ